MGNHSTGEMITEEELLKRPINEQKKFLPIPAKYADQLSAMNRKDRRAWMRKNKNLMKE